MSSSAETAPDIRVRDVRVDEERLTVDLMDGRSVAVPLAWYPRLFSATSSQRRNWETAGGGYGIHWPEIDEDLSTEGLLRGAPAPRKGVRPSRAQSRGGKYDPLRDYLGRQQHREFELTFDEIERILGTSLPRSAGRPQWWANTRGASSHVQREAWREAGFDAFLIAGSRRVRFRRVS